MTVATSPRVGGLLRDWRQRRRLSQLDLAVEAEVSARHLSFVETGRSKPSRELVIHLAEHLEVPLRERNTLLLGAGYAALSLLTESVDPTLLAPPVNALRVSLHPDGLAPRIVNFAEWASHLLSRLD